MDKSSIYKQVKKLTIEHGFYKDTLDFYIMQIAEYIEKTLKKELFRRKKKLNKILSNLDTHFKHYAKTGRVDSLVENKLFKF